MQINKGGSFTYYSAYRDVISTKEDIVEAKSTSIGSRAHVLHMIQELKVLCTFYCTELV
jgi:hypothetical protein